MNWRFVLHRAGTRVRNLGAKNSAPQKIRRVIEEQQQQQQKSTHFQESKQSLELDVHITWMLELLEFKVNE